MSDGDRGGPCGHTLSDAATKTHEAAVLAFLQAQVQANPKRVARVYAKFAHLTDAQIRYRQTKESWLSAKYEQAEELAAGMDGKRLHLPSDT